MYVYKITNKINNKCYIGITKDIVRRFSYHKRVREEENCKEYDKPLYAAIRKYGIDNFEFSVLEEGLSIEEANLREIALIKEYNSLTHNHGYNIREGGDLSGTTTRGEQHFFSKLTEEQVKSIIEARDVLKQRPTKVYKDYEAYVSYAAFEHIWLGHNWKHLQPEITKFPEYEVRIGEEASNAKLTEEQAKDIITKRDSGEYLLQEVYEPYKDIIKFSSFQDIWSGRSWKHLQPEAITTKVHGRAYLTPEQVRTIRTLKGTKSYAVIGLDYGVPASTICNIINLKAYKNVT